MSLVKVKPIRGSSAVPIEVDREPVSLPTKVSTEKLTPSFLFPFPFHIVYRVAYHLSRNDIVDSLEKAKKKFWSISRTEMATTFVL